MLVFDRDAEESAKCFCDCDIQPEIEEIIQNLVFAYSLIDKCKNDDALAQWQKKIIGTKESKVELPYAEMLANNVVIRGWFTAYLTYLLEEYKYRFGKSHKNSNMYEHFIAYIAGFEPFIFFEYMDYDPTGFVFVEKDCVSDKLNFEMMIYFSQCAYIKHLESLQDITYSLRDYPKWIAKELK